MKKLNLRIERLNNGWTLNFVGKRLGISNQSVSKIETGKSKPSYEVLCKMENLFDKPHSYLLTVSRNDTPINQVNNTRKGE